ncbi:MAG TPA: TatD family hydrolase [Actinomycetota bacterium]|nr:TatD family hydrolase [Actinomycetota bacterium]
MSGPASGGFPAETPLADSHCHVAHVEGSPDEVVRRATETGVALVVDVGMGLRESAECAARAGASDGEVFACVGVHPNELNDFLSDPPGCMEVLAGLALAGGVVAVGETGLDFYRDRWSPAEQEDCFTAHIALAKQTDRTLVIHCREAHQRVLEVLEAEGAPDRVVMHCFSGDAAHARQCADRGWWCSFAGNITYKRNDDLRLAAQEVPDELLLVETDAPYLAPHPHRGKPNSPALLPLTAAALAGVRGIPAPELAGTLWHNFHRAFGLPVPRS